MRVPKALEKMVCERCKRLFFLIDESYYEIQEEVICEKCYEKYFRTADGDHIMAMLEDQIRKTKGL